MPCHKTVCLGVRGNDRAAPARSCASTTRLVEALCKLHNVCMERNIPAQHGRVMADSYIGNEPRGTGGDQPGMDLPEWRQNNWIPPRSVGQTQADFDDPPRQSAAIANNPAARAQCQPLRNALRDNLREHGMGRPSWTTYAGYRARN